MDSCWLMPGFEAAKGARAGIGDGKRTRWGKMNQNLVGLGHKTLQHNAKICNSFRNSYQSYHVHCFPDPSPSWFFPHLLGALEEAASHQSRQDQGTDDGNGQTAEVFDVGDDAHQEDDGLQTFTQPSGEGQDEEGVFLAEAHLPVHRRVTTRNDPQPRATRELSFRTVDVDSNCGI